jgi:hypothetical protein
MTKRTAFLLILAGGLLLEVVAILGLMAVGVEGPALSLGVIVPLALSSYLSSGVVMRYGASSRRRR